MARLREWALLAEPDYVGEPDPRDTEALVRDLAAELGPRFVVMAVD